MADVTVQTHVDTFMRSATASAARDALGIQSGATYSTVAEMVAADVTNITSGQTVTLTGYYAAGDFGEPLQLIVEASTGGVKSHTLNDGRYANLYAAFLRPEWLGAKGDGSTNDVVAFRDCLDAANTNDLPVVLREVTYLINPQAGEINGGGTYEDYVVYIEDIERLTINGNNAVIKTQSSAFGTYSSGTRVKSLFRLEQKRDSVGLDLSTVTDYAEGDEEVELTAAAYAEVAEGDYVVFYNDEIASGDTVTYNKRFGTRVTQKTGSNMVKLAIRIPFSFDASQNMKMDIQSPEYNVTVRDLNFIGEGFDVASQFSVRSLDTRYCSGGNLEFIRSTGFNWSGFNISQAVNMTLVGLKATGAKYTDYGANYGIIINALYDSKMDRSHFYASRHGISTSENPSVDWVATDCTFTSARDNSGNGINSHHAFREIYRDCIIDGGVKWSGDAKYVGCKIRSDYAHVFNYRMGFRENRQLVVEDCDIDWRPDQATINSFIIIGTTTNDVLTEFGDIVVRNTRVKFDDQFTATQDYNCFLYITSSANRNTGNLDNLIMENVEFDVPNMRMFLFSGTVGVDLPLEAPSNGGGVCQFSNVRFRSEQPTYTQETVNAFKEWNWENVKPISYADFTQVNDPDHATNGIIKGRSYVIAEVGTFDFTNVGAATNTIGRRFVADDDGSNYSGTGVAYRLDDVGFCPGILTELTGAVVRLTDVDVVGIKSGGDLLFQAPNGEIIMNNVNVLRSLSDIAILIDLDTTESVTVNNVTSLKHGGKGKRDSVALRQNGVAATPLTLDGESVSGGTAILAGSTAPVDYKDTTGQGFYAVIQATNYDLSGVTFTVAGTLASTGGADSETITGGDKTQAVRGTKLWKTITSVTPDVNGNGVRVGHEPYGQYLLNVESGNESVTGRGLSIIRGGVRSDRGVNVLRNGSSVPENLNIEGMIEVSSTTTKVLYGRGSILIDPTTNDIYMNAGVDTPYTDNLKLSP